MSQTIWLFVVLGHDVTSLAGRKRARVDYNDDALDADNAVYARAKALARAERVVEKNKV
jgi:hypothetical protein